jgi:hypothetical protein
MAHAVFHVGLVGMRLVMIVVMVMVMVVMMVCV